MHTQRSMAMFPARETSARACPLPKHNASRPCAAAAHRRVELLAEANARQVARIQAHGTEVAKPVKRVRRTQREEDSLLKMLNRPQVWTLNILAWLMLCIPTQSSNPRLADRVAA
jgi:hypothetical protein